MKNKVTEDLAISDIEPRVYEVSYWLVPTISESEVPEHYVRLQKRITDATGVIISEEAPYLRETAYEMIKVINNVNKRFNEGYFGWIKFEMTPRNAVAVQDAFEADTTLIRSLIIKTVRENTNYTKRPDTKVAFEETAPEIKDEIKQTEAVAEVVQEAVIETPKEVLVEEVTAPSVQKQDEVVA